jgi:ketosteroid isomerase-like protein
VTLAAAIRPERLARMTRYCATDGLTEEQMIERLRRSYELFNRGDFNVLIEVADPEIVLVRAGGQPELRGAEALRAWLEPNAFESQVLEPTEFRVAGNRVLMRVEGTMRGAGSGIEMNAEAWSIWTFGDDDKVTRIENFLAHEEAEAVTAFAAD